MKPTAIIIGHGYTSRLGVARALGKAGYPVAIVIMGGKNASKSDGGKKPIDCYSKYVKEYYFCPSDKDILVEFLVKTFAGREDKPILFPDSDFTASAVDSNLNILSRYFVMPHINFQEGEIERWMSKEIQKQRAIEIGLNVAKGIRLSVNEGVFEIPREITYPCFCKPLATIVGGKQGLRKCCSKDELENHLAFLSKLTKSIDVLVEEFLTIDKEYALVGFSDGNNVIIPGVFNIKEMSCGGHFGVARLGEVIPAQNFSDIIEKFKLFVSSIHFVGVFDIDFLLCQGKYYFDEMNMRFGGSGTAVTQMGVNLPAMLADFLTTGECNLNNTNIDKTAIYVNDRMCLDDWYYGNISTKHFRELLNGADISFIRDDDDSTPYQIFKKEVRFIFIKRILRKIYKCIKR